MKLAGIVGLALVLISCEGTSSGDNDGLTRIRSQRDVDAYNATVQADSDKLVCTREAVIGSNIRQFVCLTVAQRERLAAEGRQNTDDLQQTLRQTISGDL